MNEPELTQNELAPLPPQPMQERPLLATLLAGAGIAALAGGVMLFLAAASTTRVRGSTVSYHLKWQEQRQLVQSEVQRGLEAESLTPSQPAEE